MKVIGLKPDSFEPRPLVDINNLYAFKGVQPVQGSNNSQLETNEHLPHDSSKYVLDFMEKLKKRRSDPVSNKYLIRRGRSAYRTQLNLNSMQSQIGAMLDKHL